MGFIERLHKECSRLIKNAVEKDEWVELGKLSDRMETTKRPAAVYRAWETKAVLHNKSYRAVVIHSSAHDKRRQKRIERELKKAQAELSKKIKEISKQEFFCQMEAELWFHKEYAHCELYIYQKSRTDRGIRPCLSCLSLSGGLLNTT